MITRVLWMFTTCLHMWHVFTHVTRVYTCDTCLHMWHVFTHVTRVYTCFTRGFTSVCHVFSTCLPRGFTSVYHVFTRVYTCIHRIITWWRELAMVASLTVDLLVVAVKHGVVGKGPFTGMARGAFLVVTPLVRGNCFSVENRSAAPLRKKFCLW